MAWLDKKQTRLLPFIEYRTWFGKFSIVWCKLPNVDCISHRMTWLIWTDRNSITDNYRHYYHRPDASACDVDAGARVNQLCQVIGVGIWSKEGNLADYKPKKCHLYTYVIILHWVASSSTCLKNESKKKLIDQNRMGNHEWKLRTLPHQFSCANLNDSKKFQLSNILSLRIAGQILEYTLLTPIWKRGTRLESYFWHSKLVMRWTMASWKCHRWVGCRGRDSPVPWIVTTIMNWQTASGNLHFPNPIFLLISF